MKTPTMKTFTMIAERNGNYCYHSVVAYRYDEAAKIFNDMYDMCDMFVITIFETPSEPVYHFQE